MPHHYVPVLQLWIFARLIREILTNPLKTQYSISNSGVFRYGKRSEKPNQPTNHLIMPALFNDRFTNSLSASFITECFNAMSVAFIQPKNHLPPIYHQDMISS